MKKRAVCRICSLALALILALGICPAALARVPDRPDNKYVLDTAGVLSEDTEKWIVAENQELFKDCGGEIVVAAVDFLGGEDIRDYTYDMFNTWEIGSDTRNNGILLVLAIGEENYFIQAGYGIDDYFDVPLFSDILNEYLEPDFAAGDYDSGVRKTFGALRTELESYYEDGPGRNDPMPEPEYDGGDWDEDSYFSGGFSLFRTLKTIAFAIIRVIVIVVIILFVFSLFRGARPHLLPRRDIGPPEDSAVSAALAAAPAEGSAAAGAPTAAEPAGTSAEAAASTEEAAPMAAEWEDDKKTSGTPKGSPKSSVYLKSSSVSMPRWSRAFLTPSSQTGVVT